jgi:hypothetical protein
MISNGCDLAQHTSEMESHGRGEIVTWRKLRRRSL